MSKTKSIIILVVLAILIGLASVATFCSFPIPNSVKDYNSIMSLIGKGIDLSGGYYVVLTPESEETDEDLLDKAMTILRTRLDNKGYTEATISVQDLNKIRIEIPEVDNAQEVLQVIGSTGELTFRDASGNVWLTGDDIESAYVGNDPENGYVCVMNFTPEGVTKFSQATKSILEDSVEDNVMYIYLGDEVQSAPQVSEQITSQSAQITLGANATYDQADAIASVIESGRLPIEYTVSESRSISARLGSTAISKSLMAGAIGLACVFVLMIIFYRGMGVASDIALFIYTLIYIIFLAIVPNIQLTLPGIAGILLSIGMAIDGNVIIFERIKDEFRSGKTVATAVDAGFKRAVITIIDGNVTTIIAAIILWLMCPGSIKGFAITLLIGVALSMLTAIFVSKWLLKVLLPLSKNKEKFFNLKRDEEVAE